MRCVDCNRQLDPSDPRWDEVIGWKQQRQQGGTNHIADPKTTGRFLCEPCMVLRKSGVAPAQGRMW